MNDEDVGGPVEGDDLALELVAQAGFDGENATDCEIIAVAAAPFHHFPSPSLSSAWK